MGNLPSMLKILWKHLPKLLNSLMVLISKTQSSTPVSPQSVTEKHSSDLPYKHLIHSDVAAKHGIDNTPNTEQIKNLQLLNLYIYMPIELDLRKDGIVLKMESGFRSKELNMHKEIGGSETSDHMQGFAVDLSATKNGVLVAPEELFNRIKALNLPIKQLIKYPKKGFCHASLDISAQPRREYLTL